jgi:hypothetical protein
MALTQAKLNADDPRRYYREVRSGARTAADFTVTLGFTPTKVEVTNATDKISAIWHSDVPTPNALQLKTVAAGTRTYEDCGVSVTGKVISVTIATATLETDNDVTIIEAWG